MPKQTSIVRGKYVLIAHVLHSMHMYLLLEMNPPTGVIEILNYLHNIFGEILRGPGTSTG